MTGKLIIYVDITDLEEDSKRKELMPESEEDIVEELANGRSPLEIGSSVLVTRERGRAPQDIIRPNKLLLQSGAQMDIISIAHRQKLKMKTESGKEYQLPKFIGTVAEHKENGKEEEDAEETQANEEISYVSSESAEGMRRSIEYLERIVPGHIRNRLYVIYHNGGDVRNEADKLIETINEIVGELQPRDA